MNTLTIISVLLPLFGFLLNGIFGKKIKSEKIIGFIGSGTIGASFLIGIIILVKMLQMDPASRNTTVTLFQWMAAGSFEVYTAFGIDQLSIVMMLIVTGVGFLIHVYSIGYMHGDPGFWRFFSYMNLFIFMMLNLVLGNNFLHMFLGWEGVGLCSYLLIGFWHDRKFDTGGYKEGEATTSDAAKKAFIVNRVGDFGFLIAMFLIFKMFGSLNFSDVFSTAPILSNRGDDTITWITLLLFLGATGKSAQIPLYIWLPDAMAGPTPVSALIHAATMVTAGVYMVARCSVLFALSPLTMDIVAIIGVITAFFAATMGLVQNDIKKILAYSTISQLGYMFLGLGVGAFSAGIFHVMTHAFFNALLFLGSGSVIHAMHEEQNIQKMGGLKKTLPVTYKTFLIATFAISGIPPLAGFFSKDEILWKTFSDGSTALWILGWITAGLTAFYMFRLVSLTFEGESRWTQDYHPHEAPKVMTVPLIILALLSVVGGFIGVPHSLGGSNAFEKWLEPIFVNAQTYLTLHHETGLNTEYIIMILSVIISVLGIIYARRIYLSKPEIIDKLIKKFSWIYQVLWNKYYVDEAYEMTIVNPIKKGSEKLLWKGFDVAIIDGIVNGTANAISIISGLLRKVQMGLVQNYALIFVIGIVILFAFIIFK